MTPHHFIINTNTFLHSEVNGFYHTTYSRFKTPGNPDYINYLKNTYDSFPLDLLDRSVSELRSALLVDLPKIKAHLKFSSLVVCVVPRSKAITQYKPNQLLFSKTIQDVVNETGIFTNGVNYIIRHTNTQTTHLPASTPNYTNDGDAPYPGITNATCTISDHVIGQNILLIDDVYTNNINIDEDMIQSLLDAGARSVAFYAIGKTPG